MRATNNIGSEHALLDEISDLSENDENEMPLEDDRFFTVDSRSCPIDFEKNLSMHDTANEWYLFNHYSVTPISAEEVLSVDLSWKIPSTLMYIRSSLLGDAQSNKALRRIKTE